MANDDGQFGRVTGLICLNRAFEKAMSRSSQVEQKFFANVKWRALGDSNPCYRRERAVS
jgi:hypothetical protein